MTNQQKFGISIKKEEDFSEWYCQVVTKSELIDYYTIKGCYIMRPLSLFVWNKIRDFFNKKIQKLNVQEYYFPMLVTKSSLEKEKDHIENFAPELAWITSYGNVLLDNPVAIRPTSESIMYPCFSKWLRSHRDLPLKVNQWCNILRWEVKSTTPFIRAREFLWQEGHTAFLTKEESDKEVLQILDFYAQIYQDLLAIPVIKGIKSENEKFGGALYTTTVEAFIPGSGRGVQAATSHSLGTNFSRMYDIKVSSDMGSDGNNDSNKNKSSKNSDKNSDSNKISDSSKISDNNISNKQSSDSFVHQNSWGITTRTIGISTMVHSDNKGLVLPPKVAMYQVVIIPCGITVGRDTTPLFTYIHSITRNLSGGGCDSCNDLSEGCMCSSTNAKRKELDNNAPVRYFLDDKDNVSPGYKFNYWEIRGVPLRMEIGFKEMNENTITMVRRLDGKKIILQNKEILKQIQNELLNIHSLMYLKAKKERDERIVRVDCYSRFVEEIENRNIVLVPWCCSKECEDDIKNSEGEGDNANTVPVGVKCMCIPYDNEDVSDKGCFNCNKSAKSLGLFGRSY